MCVCPGWHVHEKAILMVTLPLALLAFEDVQSSRLFLLLNTIGNYSLFPLLYRPQGESTLMLKE